MVVQDICWTFIGLGLFFMSYQCNKTVSLQTKQIDSLTNGGRILNTSSPLTGPNLTNGSGGLVSDEITATTETNLNNNTQNNRTFTIKYGQAINTTLEFARITFNICSKLTVCLNKGKRMPQEDEQGYASGPKNLDINSVSSYPDQVYHDELYDSSSIKTFSGIENDTQSQEPSDDDPNNLPRDIPDNYVDEELNDYIDEEMIDEANGLTFIIDNNVFRKRRHVVIYKKGNRKVKEILGSKQKRSVDSEKYQETFEQKFEHENKRCHCDQYCVLYGDCCVDVVENVLGINSTMDLYSAILEAHSRLTLNVESNNLFWLLESDTVDAERVIENFINKFSSCEHIDEYNNLMVVSQCPRENIDASLKQRCENPISPFSPPVSVALPGGDVTFKNTACAQCHGFNGSSLQSWNNQISCDNDFKITDWSSFILKKLINNGICLVLFQIPEKFSIPRICDPELQLTENDKQLIIKNINSGQCSQNDNILCKLYNFPINKYKNPHCQKCMEPVNMSLEHSTIKEDCSSKGYNNLGNENPRKGGIILILDITGSFTSTSNLKPFYICNNDEVFNPVTFECKKLLCSIGQEPFRGNCIDSLNSYFVPKSSQIFPTGWDKFDLLVDIPTIKNELLYCEMCIGIQSLFISDIESIITGNSYYTDDNVDQECYSSFNNSKQKTSFYKEISVTNEFPLNILNLVLEYISSIINNTMKTKIQFLMTNVKSFDNSSEPCLKNHQLTQRTDFKFVEYKGLTYAIFNSTKNGFYYPFKNIGFEIRGSSLPRTLISNVYVCEASKLLSRSNCSVVEYHLNETRLVGSRLLLIDSDLYFNEGDFNVLSDTVILCSNFGWPNKTNDNKQSWEYFIMSCILTSISVIFLLLMLAVYCLFSELRTLPLKLITSLALTMMFTYLSNFFTLFNFHHDYFCPIAAALSHVITLSQFGWMSVIAVNMALTFRSHANSLIKNENSRKTFFYLNLVVWGLAITLVIVSVAFDLAHPETTIESKELDNRTVTSKNVSVTLTPISASLSYLSSSGSSEYPRYGHPFCTWFSGPLWARLAFMVIPYFISAFINIICFIITIYGIHQSCKISARLGKRSSTRNQYLIYIKLSTTVGFSWILSILTNIFPDSEALSCIYLSLVLVQGLLLFLAFTANKSVYTLLVQRINTKLNKRRHSGKTNSSSFKDRSSFRNSNGTSCSTLAITEPE